MDMNCSYSISSYDEKTGKIIFKTIHPLDESLDSIKTRFEELIQANQSLFGRLQELKQEKWADERLIEMKDKLKTMSEEYYRGFPISAEAESRINEWKKNHRHNGGAIGGTFTYEFIPTSIGTIGTIKCACGDSFTFEDL